MEAEVVIKIADNIISPLGSTTAENYQAILSGRSELRFYEGLWDLPEPCVLSLIPRQQYPTHDGHTLFEELAIRSASSALQECGLDPSSPRVQFVVSTTKGNVHLLGEQPSSYEADRVLLPVAAQVIADHFRNPLPPVVVSNACTSGLTAQIVAMRLLQQRHCDYAVVIGADIQSPFIVSGFQSFKALSPTPCRPYDQGRTGLNLGEAAATMILKRVPAGHADGWQLVRGAVRNDANHISGPSRTGEGSYQALKAVLREASEAEGLTCLIAGSRRRQEKLLSLLGEDAPPVIRRNMSLPERGPVFMELALVKGLEFDAVILADADPEEYPDSDLGRHRLYTAISRATRKVSIFAESDMTPLLAGREERK